MDVFIETMQSPSFSRIMYLISLSCLVLVVGICVISYKYYQHGRAAETAKAGPGTIILATWRDSLIITLLFVAEALVYRFAEFNDLSRIFATQISAARALVPPLVSLIVLVLIFLVAVFRIIAITDWLRAQAADPQPSHDA